ncbi:MAG: DUF192 domain-containing protein [Acidimicrobiia bacterium]
MVLWLVACATTTTTTAASTSATEATTTTTGSTIATPTGELPDLPTTSISIAGVDLQVWMADDAAERNQGLRQVESLPADIDGMLFVWDEPTETAFVMEDTLVPLDVWFFDEEGELVGSHEMTPCTTDPCSLYPTPGPVSWALETPQGGQEFEIGDRLSTSELG